MSMREFCVALLAGTVGVGGGVVVEKATTKPVVARKAPARTPQVRAPQAAPSSSLLRDCPLPSAVIGDLGGGVSALSDIPGWSGLPPIAGQQWDGGWIGAPFQPPEIPAIPEPEGWAMLVSGFGLIGMACRRKRTSA